MAVFNLVGSICSIISLLVAIFIAGKVIRIDNSIKKSNTVKSTIKGNSNIVSGENTTISK